MLRIEVGSRRPLANWRYGKAVVAGRRMVLRIREQELHSLHSSHPLGIRATLVLETVRVFIRPRLIRSVVRQGIPRHVFITVSKAVGAVAEKGGILVQQGLAATSTCESGSIIASGGTVRVCPTRSNLRLCAPPPQESARRPARPPRTDSSDEHQETNVFRQRRAGRYEEGCNRGGASCENPRFFRRTAILQPFWTDHKIFRSRA